MKASDPNKVIKGLRDYEGVRFIRKVDKYHDVIIFAEFDSIKLLSEFVFFKIRPISGVKDTETTIMVEE
ncbi:MAG: Lrp/AsnC ligand binding domain-containing protein [Candidatus Methanofastidiosia archaeon]